MIVSLLSSISISATGTCICRDCKGKGQKVCTTCNGKGSYSTPATLKACNYCNGTGKYNTGSKIITCTGCNGTGKAYSSEIVQCSKCSGSGYYGFCLSCNGRGFFNDHSWDSGAIIKGATCVSEGEKRYTCRRCGDKKSEAIEKTGVHRWNSGVVTRLATCTSGGELSYKCLDCGITKTERTAVDSTNHNWQTYGIVEKYANCKEEGILSFTCYMCHATKTEPIPKTDEHTFDTCTKLNDSQHSYKCSVCGITVTDDHYWDYGVCTTPATCQKDGVKTYTCEECYATKTEPIAKSSAHQFGTWVNTKASTCKTVGIRTRTCSVCGQTEQEELSLGQHTFGKWSVSKSATCTENGSEQRRCRVCDTIETRELTAIGHSWRKWEQTKAPSEKEVGEEKRVCKNDKTHIETREIPKLKPGETPIRIIEGEDSIVEQGNDVEFVLNIEVPNNAAVSIDDKEVEKSDFKCVGAKIIVKSSFIESLSIGKHSITIATKDKNVSAEFELVEKVPSESETGSETGSEAPNNNVQNDNMIWIIIGSVIVAAVASGIAILIKKRRKFNIVTE